MYMLQVCKESVFVCLSFKGSAVNHVIYDAATLVHPTSRHSFKCHKNYMTSTEIQFLHVRRESKIRYKLQKSKMYFGDKDRIQFQCVRVESEVFTIIEWLKNKCALKGAESVTECMAE